MHFTPEGASAGRVFQPASPSSPSVILNREFVVDSPEGAGPLPEGAAARRLRQYQRQDTARRVLPAGHSVGYCLRHMDADRVRVKFSPSEGRAYYTGLSVCGLVWACPVCSPRIATGRAEELRRVMAWAHGQGYAVLMATETFRHGERDALAAMVDRFRSADRYMRSTRAYVKLRREFGLLHTVRALEVTLGQGGPHVHGHELEVFAARIDLDAYRLRRYEVWRAAAAHFGLTMTRRRGLTIRAANPDRVEYVAKWGFADELARASVKSGRKAGRYLPFQLLDVYAESGWEWAGRAFAEYVAAFKGRSQLQYSPGLKRLAAEPERTDRELAAAAADDPVELALLHAGEWAAVRYYRQRGGLLEVARGGDAAAVRAFVDQVYLRFRLASRTVPALEWARSFGVEFGEGVA